MEVNSETSEAEIDPLLHEFDQLEEEKCINSPKVPRINEIEIEEKRASQKMQDQKDKPSAEQMKDEGDEIKELGQDI